MKNFILILCFLLLSSQAFASSHHLTNITNISNNYSINDPAKIQPELGAELEAPNLVKLPYDLFLGFEAGKDLYNNNYTQGYFVYGKISWNGTFLDLSGKK